MHASDWMTTWWRLTLNLLSTRSWSFFARSPVKKWVHDNVIFSSVYNGQLRLCMSYLLCGAKLAGGKQKKLLILWLIAITHKYSYGVSVCQKSLNVPRYSAETELSKYAWKLKKSGKQYYIKWSILKRSHAYTAGAARCNLCLEEKVCLLEADKSGILNKRSELFAKCCHRNSSSARKFERTRDASANR
jgi:hypothetical protein